MKGDDNDEVSALVLGKIGGEYAPSSESELEVDGVLCSACKLIYVRLACK